MADVQIVGNVKSWLFYFNAHTKDEVLNLIFNELITNEKYDAMKITIESEDDADINDADDDNNDADDDNNNDINTHDNNNDENNNI